MNPIDESHILFEKGESWPSDPAPMVTPVFQTSNFKFSSVKQLREALENERSYSIYTRGENPTVAVPRKKIAALEKVEDGLLFGSGMAAIAAGIMSQVRKGGHIVSVENPYPWATHLIENYLTGLGITHTFVDGKDNKALEAAIQEDTKLIYLESPNTFTFDLQDLEAVAKIAKKHAVCTMIDNSYCSPLNQRPADFGIDLIAHSATKYLAGHSDVVAGFLGGSSERIQDIFEQEYMTFGGIIGPQDASLLLRGLRTLPLRMERVAQSTPQIVDFLLAHPLVQKVHYPFLPDNPQRELAKKQMRSPGGQFSFELQGGEKAAIAFCDALEAFRMAVSWGGHESLVFPVAAKRESPHYRGLIRAYIGLEAPEYLINDLKNALEAVKKANNA